MRGWDSPQQSSWNAQQAGKLQLYTWLLQPLISSLLEKVPCTELILCCFQMGSQLGHSKHMPSSFVFPPFRKG